MNTVDKAKEYAEGKVTEALSQVVADAYALLLGCDDGSDDGRYLDEVRPCACEDAYFHLLGMFVIANVSNFFGLCPQGFEKLR